eukprot:4226886-Amphidinium_carterae.1
MPVLNRVSAGIKNSCPRFLTLYLTSLNTAPFSLQFCAVPSAMPPSISISSSSLAHPHVLSFTVLQETAVCCCETAATEASAPLKKENT